MKVGIFISGAPQDLSLGPKDPYESSAITNRAIGRLPLEWNFRSNVNPVTTDDSGTSRSRN